MSSKTSSTSVGKRVAVIIPSRKARQREIAKHEMVRLNREESPGMRGILLAPALADQPEVHRGIERLVRHGPHAYPVERPPLVEPPAISGEQAAAALEAEARFEQRAVPERVSIPVAQVV